MTGSVILDSLQLPAFLTGLVTCAPFLVSWWAFRTFSSSIPGSLGLGLGLLVLLFVSCRFALGGLAGDSLGGLLSDSGWELRDVFVVFLRYIALLAAWILPFAGLWWLYSPRLPWNPRPGGLPGEFPALLSLYALSVIVAPSALLTAASAANQLRDMVSSDLWRGLFKERTGEFFLVVFSAVGAPFSLLVLFLPFLALAYNQSQAFFLALAGLVGIYVTGVTVALHGRLCGFFARAVMAGAEAVEPGAEEPAPVSTGPAHTDLESELKSARDEFEIEPERGIAKLESLLEAGRDPRIGHTLAEMCQKTGKQELALRSARHAITLYVQKGEARNAVAVYRMMGGAVSQAGLPVSALIAVGEVFLTEGDTAAASHALGSALIAEAGNLKAFKGLLKVADQFAARPETAGQAVKVYEFLLQTAPKSPFIEHARSGLEMARRKTGKDA